MNRRNIENFWQDRKSFLAGEADKRLHVLRCALGIFYLNKQRVGTSCSQCRFSWHSYCFQFPGRQKTILNASKNDTTCTSLDFSLDVMRSPTHLQIGGILNFMIVSKSRILILRKDIKTLNPVGYWWDTKKFILKQNKVNYKIAISPRRECISRIVENFWDCVTNYLFYPVFIDA